MTTRGPCGRPRSRFAVWGDEAGGRGLPSLPLGLGRGKWRNVREAFVAPRSLVAAQRC